MNEKEAEPEDEGRDARLVAAIHAAFDYERARGLERHVLKGARDLESDAEALMRRVLAGRLRRTTEETQENGFLYALATDEGDRLRLTLAHIVPIRRMQLPVNLELKIDMQNEHRLLLRMVAECRMAEFARAMSERTENRVQAEALDQHAAALLKIVAETLRQGYDRIEMGTQLVRVNGMMRPNRKAALELCLQTIASSEEAK